MIWIIISACIIGADQAVKYLIASGMTEGDTLFSMGLFDITYVKNQGAAFSILSGKLPLLSIISIVFCIGVIVFWVKKRPSNRLLCAAVTLLFSGALANALDRILRGFVVDYINLTFINFPVFNIADMAITIGAVMLVLYEIKFDRD